MNVFWEEKPNLEINLGKKVVNKLYSKPPKFTKLFLKPLYSSPSKKSVNTIPNHSNEKSNEDLNNQFLSRNNNISEKPSQLLEESINSFNQNNIPKSCAHQPMQKEITLDSILENSIISSLSYERKNNTNRHLRDSILDQAKKERSKKVKEILDQIRRKSQRTLRDDKGNKLLHSNNNLKIYGELSPGPGDYDPKYGDEIKSNHYYSYSVKNSLTENERKQNLGLIVKKLEDKYYGSKLGPGCYNNIYSEFNSKLNSNANKGFISSLGRPAFINEDNMNPYLGPGSYEVKSEFDKNRKRLNGINFLSFSFKKRRKEDKNRLDLIEKNIFNYNNFDSKMNNNRYLKPNEFNNSSKKNINFKSVDFENDYIRRQNIIFSNKEKFDRNEKKDCSDSNNKVDLLNSYKKLIVIQAADGEKS